MPKTAAVTISDMLNPLTGPATTQSAPAPHRVVKNVPAAESTHYGAQLLITYAQSKLLGLAVQAQADSAAMAFHSNLLMAIPSNGFSR
jgi:hypothetical protein